MGKKRTSRVKSDLESAGKVKVKRSSKLTDALLALPLPERIEIFERSPFEQWLVLFDESYPADVVNVLLDMKKATVKRFFEGVSETRKRDVAQAATLYHYKEYLTNPLPLQVETGPGGKVPNYYAILGVPRDVSEEELKIAYKLLARAHSPEVFSPAMRAAGAERLEEITDAFNNLRSPKRRSRADKLLPNINYLYPRRDQSWLEAVLRFVN
jgi:hypothetical protein